MCGIAGAVGLDARPDPQRSVAVLDALAHRGPDASGELFRHGVWLGFRRLAIQDLDRRSDQPFVDPRTGVAVVFNGEIYDFVELRRELERRGWTFRTTGDTEVLLAGYLEWGLGVFQRANGMWACAIHDPSREDVLLARDRFGEKPLHVGRAADGWWFASEVRALQRAGAGTGRADPRRVAAYCGHGDVEDPGSSFLEGIEQVEPASIVRLAPQGPSPARRYWRVEDVLDRARRAPAPDGEAVRAALDEAVRVRLRADVPVGTSLSGGVDSSAVVASIRAVDPSRTLHAFTASFPGEPVDEWSRAERVARRYGVELHRVVPTPEGFLDEIDLLVDRQGGPIESPTVYAQWCVMRAARDAGITVLLDGQGADEVFGGYLKYLWIGVADALRSGRPGSAARTLSSWRALGDLPRPRFRQLAPVLAPSPVATLAGVEVPRARHGWGLLERAAGADLRRLVLPRLLRYADRSSMAWSREIRLPFLDPAVVSTGLSAGWDEGLRHGWTKLALRRAVESRLPGEVVWRREKTAYEVPEETWLARPDFVDAVAAARRRLRELEVLDASGRHAGRSLGPWRALSLARFLDVYGVGL